MHRSIGQTLLFMSLVLSAVIQVCKAAPWDSAVAHAERCTAAAAAWEFQ